MKAPTGARLLARTALLLAFCNPASGQTMSPAQGTTTGPTTVQVCCQLIDGTCCPTTTFVIGSSCFCTVVTNDPTVTPTAAPTAASTTITSTTVTASSVTATTVTATTPRDPITILVSGDNFCALLAAFTVDQLLAFYSLITTEFEEALLEPGIVANVDAFCRSEAPSRSRREAPVQVIEIIVTLRDSTRAETEARLLALLQSIADGTFTISFGGLLIDPTTFVEAYAGTERPDTTLAPRVAPPECSTICAPSGKKGLSRDRRGKHGKGKSSVKKVAKWAGYVGKKGSKANKAAQAAVGPKTKKAKKVKKGPGKGKGKKGKQAALPFDCSVCDEFDAEGREIVSSAGTAMTAAAAGTTTAAGTAAGGVVVAKEAAPQKGKGKVKKVKTKVGRKSNPYKVGTSAYQVHNFLSGPGHKTTIAHIAIAGVMCSVVIAVGVSMMTRRRQGFDTVPVTTFAYSVPGQESVEVEGSVDRYSDAVEFDESTPLASAI